MPSTQPIEQNEDKETIRAIFHAISNLDYNSMHNLLHPEVNLEWSVMATGDIENVFGREENIRRTKITGDKTDFYFEIEAIYGDQSPYTVINHFVIKSWEFSPESSVGKSKGKLRHEHRFRYFWIIWVEDGMIKRWLQESNRFNYLKALGLASFNSGKVEVQRNYVELLKAHGFIPQKQAVDDYIQLINEQKATSG